MLEQIGRPQNVYISTPIPEVLQVLRMVQAVVTAPTVAEIGVGVGATTAEIVRTLGGKGTLHIFDYEEKIASLLKDFASLDYAAGVAIVGHGNSRRSRDSYAWRLAMLAKSTGLKLDLAFLDGAHNFECDAPACCLLKEMINPGGFLIFDDLFWTFASSPTMNPEALPRTRERYSDEQLVTAHVGLVVDLFMRTDPRFEQVFLSENRKPGRGVFRRVR
jgi:predicted O-methyltransferase YrrM